MSPCLSASWREVKKWVLGFKQVYFYNEWKLISRKIYFILTHTISMDSSHENISVNERPLR